MYVPEVRAFLQRPLLARMSVIDTAGFPHTVPVNFVMDGDDVIITTVRSTRKVAYIRANPKGSIVIGGEHDQGSGYLLKGLYSIEEDPGLRWLKRTAYHHHPHDHALAERTLAEFSQKDMIILRLRVQQVIKVL
jgi:hypothetical protein